MKITLTSRLLESKACVENAESVNLKLNESFGHEDILFFEMSKEEMLKSNCFVKITLDQYLKPALIYMPEGKLMYAIPSGWKRKAYDPAAFESESIDVSMELVDKDELKVRRNLALNSLDVRGEMVNYYPHADANVVTRDEPWFEARNTIDGNKAQDGHGQYPYHSWGGGLRDDLEFRLYFGREVLIDEIILYLRADYKDDHDIHWNTALIEFSNGETLDIEMVKSTSGQSYTFPQKKVTWIKLKNLSREVSAAFSALSQIEVYGIEA